MADLNSKYRELINEIFINFTFYIPLSIFNMKEFKNLSLDSNFIDTWIDKIIYIDNDFNFVNDGNIKLAACVVKSDKLQRNCFKLLDYKEELSKSSFDYLAENYLKQVETYAFISSQLFLYFDKNSPIKDDITKTIFNYQNQDLNNHLKEVERITDIKTQIFNKEKIIDEVKGSEVYKRLPPIFPKTDTYFRDFISHEKSSEIENSIIHNYPIIKGRKLRYIIEFLIKKEALTITYGTQTKLYNALKRTFNCNIGTYSSIFGYKINENKDSDYSRIATELETILNDYFKLL